MQDNLGGPKIVSVTYPSFTSDGIHFVLYLRLKGGSGAADSHFFEYQNGQWIINDEASSRFIAQRWSGGDKTVNAYLHGLVIHNGRRYLTWCWRDTPNPRTCHDLCFAYSDDQGRTWKNNDGERIGVLGKTPITADTPGVAAIAIPPGTRYQNGGSMVVDHNGRVHVLMQGEDGKPVHFQRDPVSGKWSRQGTTDLGKLVTGPGDALYIVGEQGLQRTVASAFGTLESVAAPERDYFRDSKIGMDRMRDDGWISVIGQRKQEVTVVDYWIGK